MLIWDNLSTHKIDKTEGAAPKLKLGEKDSKGLIGHSEEE